MEKTDSFYKGGEVLESKDFTTRMKSQYLEMKWKFDKVFDAYVKLGLDEKELDTKLVFALVERKEDTGKGDTKVSIGVLGLNSNELAMIYTSGIIQIVQAHPELAIKIGTHLSPHMMDAISKTLKNKLKDDGWSEQQD